MNLSEINRCSLYMYYYNLQATTKLHLQSLLEFGVLKQRHLE